eukprot:jgi/Hompol1/374/HPOL_000232-RA
MASSDTGLQLAKDRFEWRWTVLALSSCILFGNFFAYDLPAALNVPLKDHLGLSDSDYAFHLNLFYALYSLPNIILPFFGGHLSDRFGTQALLIGLSTLVCIGQLIISIGVTTQSTLTIHIGRILFGIGGESLAVVQTRITATWFRGSEIALALGVNLSVARMGSVFNDLVSPVVALRMGVPAAAWVGLVTCLSSLLCAASLAYLDRKFPDPYPAAQVMIHHAHAADLHIPRKRIAATTAAAATATTKTTARLKKDISSRMPTSRSKEYLAILTSDAEDTEMESESQLEQTSSSSSGSGGSLTLQFWLVCLLMLMGIPDTISALLVPVVGSIVDHIGHRITTLLVCSLIMMSCHLYLGFATDKSPSPIPALVFLGVAYSMLLTFWTCIPLIVDETVLGMAFGIATASLNASLTLFPILIATLLANDPTYFSTEMFFVLCCGFGACVCCVMFMVDRRLHGSVLQVMRVSKRSISTKRRRAYQCEIGMVGMQRSTESLRMAPVDTDEH